MHIIPGIRTVVLLLSLSIGRAVGDVDYFPASLQKVGEYEAGILRGMDEPSLYKMRTDTNVVAYRLLWMRAFDPIRIYRVDISQTGTTVRVKQASELDEYGHYVAITGACVLAERTLSVAEAKDVQFWISRSSFWASQSEGPWARRNATDGSTWILEGLRGGQYHVTYRCNPLPPYGDDVGSPASETAGKDGVRPSSRDPSHGAGLKREDESSLDVLCLYFMILGRVPVAPLY